LILFCIRFPVQVFALFLIFFWPPGSFLLAFWLGGGSSCCRALLFLCSFPWLPFKPPPGTLDHLNSWLLELPLGPVPFTLPVKRIHSCHLEFLLFIPPPTDACLTPCFISSFFETYYVVWQRLYFSRRMTHPDKSPLFGLLFPWTRRNQGAGVCFPLLGQCPFAFAPRCYPLPPSQTNWPRARLFAYFANRFVITRGASGPYLLLLSRGPRG